MYYFIIKLQSKQFIQMKMEMIRMEYHAFLFLHKNLYFQYTVDHSKVYVNEAQLQYKWGQKQKKIGICFPYNGRYLNFVVFNDLDQSSIQWCDTYTINQSHFEILTLF